MKKVLIIILNWLIGFGLIYLICVFAKLDFNIVNWDENTRGMCAIIGVGIGIMFSFCSVVLFDED